MSPSLLENNGGRQVRASEAVFLDGFNENRKTLCAN